MKSFRIAALLLLLPSLAPAQATRAHFDTLPDGTAVDVYTLTSPQVELRVITYGARVVSLKSKDREGKFANIVLGFPSLDLYAGPRINYLGATVGRYANRIGKGHLVVDGKTFQTPLNNRGNTLHGGAGFDRRNWTAHLIPGGVEFTLVSPDGDQGFPGEVTARVRYTLQRNTVRIEYSATTTQPTVINLTNHAYFNIAGEGSGTILSQRLTLYADRYTPVDATLIPTGELPPVAGTPFDFTRESVIGDHVAKADSDEQLKPIGGFDHNFVLRGPLGKLHPAARVTDPASGRTLFIQTTEPGIQCNTGQGFDGSLIGVGGVAYGKFGGIALETQHYPDSPNHSNFPSTEVRPNHPYHSLTTWTLTTTPNTHP
ncbi:MAG TPA: aldose epimerase family protein [Acidobacteriaceae bacterium]|jgi:aldose 1-epimerase